MPTLRPAAPIAVSTTSTEVAGDLPARGVPADPQKFKVTVGPSAIDGQGAFAGEPIPARRKIGDRSLAGRKDIGIHGRRIPSSVPRACL